MARSRVYVEEGKDTVFAISLDWPGWCRRAKTTDLAIAALDGYRGRYAKIVTTTFRPGSFEIIGTTKGNGTTDFGAPDTRGPWDDDELTPGELHRQLAILQDCWNYFDAVVENAPNALQRGPRGGGATVTASSTTSEKPSARTVRGLAFAWHPARHGTNSATWC